MSELGFTDLSCRLVLEERGPGESGSFLCPALFTLCLFYLSPGALSASRTDGIHVLGIPARREASPRLDSEFVLFVGRFCLARRVSFDLGFPSDDSHWVTGAHEQ